MDETLISRGEVVGQVSNAAMVESPRTIERRSRATMGTTRLTKADLERHDRMRESAERTRRLAENALAELPPGAGEPRERAGSSGAWLRELAERAQAELDERKQRG